jgi:phosphoribosylformylglycinamidine synthase
LLPGPTDGAWPAQPALATVALSNNASARFEDRWTRMEIPADTVCVWTRGLACDGDDAMLPCAHGEGRFVTSQAWLDALESRGQVAIRYAATDNFNGSMGAVAGLCDASGLVFGLMPHPERYTRFTQHPWWTRLPADTRRGAPLGLRMFQSAVACARGEEVAR